MNPTKSSRKRSVMLTPQGWEKLQQAKQQSENQQNTGDTYTLEELSELTGLDSDTVAKVLEREKGVDRRTLERFFKAFNLQLEENDYTKLTVNAEVSETEVAYANRRQDFTEAVDISVFYGRKEELATLQQWIVEDRCRVVALLGMGGIGKTTLSIRTAEQMGHQFDCVIWKSLLHAPPIQDILVTLIKFLGDEQETDLSDTIDSQVAQLLAYLRERRCLLILDNFEAILQSGERAGQCREGYEGYGKLLKRVGETRHQSCLILTSRENPKEIALLEGELLPVRSLQLNGLDVADGQAILKTKRLRASEDELRLLVERYSGNPLALKIVATMIQDTLDGQASDFLSQKAAVFGDICELLKQQFNRLSSLETEVMYWLAIEREPISLAQLQENIVLPVPQLKLLEALESLRRRSLLERFAANFSLQPVIMEYVTNHFIKQVCQEIMTGQFIWFRSHALLKATAKDFVRETQVSLILQPVLDELLSIFKSKSNIENQLNLTLKTLRETSLLEPGYAGGNLLNLFCQLKTDLSNYDFSYLTIRQAYLQEYTLHGANFQNADLTRTVFAQTVGSVVSVAFSPDGKLFATGDANGQVHIWQAADGKQLLICQGHTGWIRSVAFSPQGRILVSGSSDSSIRLWDIRDGTCLKILQGHEDRVRAVAFSSNGDTLASASDDCTLRLWDIRDGTCLNILQGHTEPVRAVAFSPNGDALASASDDRTLRLWDIRDGTCLKILQGHEDKVWSVAFHPQGTTLASGSEDKTVRLWDVCHGECIRIMPGHGDGVWAVAFHPQGTTLASGSHDHTIKIWDISTGKTLRTLQGHRGWVWSIAFAPSSKILVSGGDDSCVKLWDTSTGQALKTISGHSDGVWSIAFSPEGTTLASASNNKELRLWDVSKGQILKTISKQSDAIWSVAFCPQGKKLATGGNDKIVKLWDAVTGQCLKSLSGHTAWVWSVSFSPQGNAIASGSVDRTVRLWDVSTGECLNILQGNVNIVRAVAFSPDGQILASASADSCVRLWDVAAGQTLRILQGHAKPVSSVAFSPSGRMLASGSNDLTVRLWDVSTGECSLTLQGHTNWVQSVAFSADGKILASGSDDQTVRLWDVSTGKCKRILQEHQGWVWSIAFSPDGQTLASASLDETIKFWDTHTGQCFNTLRSKRLYEGMKITGVTGLTDATITSLKVLGAS